MGAENDRIKMTLRAKRRRRRKSEKCEGRRKLGAQTRGRRDAEESSGEERSRKRTSCLQGELRQVEVSSSTRRCLCFSFSSRLLQAGANVNSPCHVCCQSSSERLSVCKAVMSNGCFLYIKYVFNKLEKHSERADLHQEFHFPSYYDSHTHTHTYIQGYCLC